MTNTIAPNIKIPSKYSFVVSSEEELVEKLAESAKYTDEECSDFEDVFKRLRKKLREKI
jgi:hypothetical protein